jgi:fused signal recognition particle receptor
VEDEKGIATYDVNYPIAMAIEEMRNEFLPLTIGGTGDIEGYQRVDAARKFVKAERVSVEKKRVEYKADILEAGRLVDSRAKAIIEPLSEIEKALQARTDEIDAARERISFEDEQRGKLPDRMAKLAGIGVTQDTVPADELLKLDDAAFDAMLNRLNAERLERQRIEQERIAQEQRAEQERIEADTRALEEKRLAAEREAKHQAEVEQARKEAAEKARIQAEIDAQRSEEARIRAEAEAKAEQERIEAEKPDREKLHSLALAFGSISYPVVSSKRAAAKITSVMKQVQSIVDELESFR